jgi:hypothetical protein
VRFPSVGVEHQSELVGARVVCRDLAIDLPGVVAEGRYLSTRDVHEGSGASGLPRLPAAELEATVVERLRRVLRAPRMMEDVMARAAEIDPALDEAQFTVAIALFRPLQS